MRTRTKIVVSVVTVAVLVAAVVGAALAARGAARDGGFVIDRFERHVVVADDASLEVTETIEVTFLEPRRGIFRDLEGAGPAGAVTYELLGVDRGTDGDEWTSTTERTPEGDPRVRIGDADVVLEPGPQTYRLRYRIHGLLFRPEARPEQAQLRMDIPGDRWPTDVATTTLTVELPAEPTSVRCTAATAGATGSCEDASVTGTQVTQTTGPLEPSETATVALEFPAASLATGPDALPVTAVEEVTDRETFASLGVPLVPAALLLLVLLAVPAALLETARARRVYRDHVTDPHLHDRVTPTAELEPPDGLAPVEVAGLRQSTIDADELMATLVDLELRGIVRTETSDDGDRISVGPGPNPERARPWEAAALEALCPGGQRITFDGEYDAETTERSSAAQRALAKHAGQVLSEDSRYVHREGGALRGGGYVLLIVLVLAIGGVIGLLGTSLLDVPFLAVVVAWVGLGVAWLVLALTWRKERLPLTSEGRDVVARTEAFRTFLSEVHADRLEFAAGQREVGTTHPAVAMLPYAMVLGLADSWLDRFEPMLVEAVRNGQGGGASGTGAWYLHRNTLVAATAAHSSTVTNPASSSGGGSFGGGGAGSGGGGGGGGSW